MKAQNIELVKKSWSLIEQMDQDIVGGLFYKRLFEIAPQVKPMFSEISIPEQSRKLVTMLTYIIKNVDRFDTILDEVVDMARRHVQYGVKSGDYAPVGQALLWTLENAFGKYWTADFNGAWTEVYNALATALIEVDSEQADQ